MPDNSVNMNSKFVVPCFIQIQMSNINIYPLVHIKK